MLRNCADCNQVYVHAVNKLCPDCTKKRNEQFTKVKEYLRQHPMAKIHEVVSETGVELERVREFIDEGRLRIVPIDVTLHCQICGVVIPSGRICSQCELELTGTEEAEQHDQKAKMHLLESWEKQNRKK